MNRYTVICLMLYATTALCQNIVCDEVNDCYYVPDVLTDSSGYPALILLHCMGATRDYLEAFIDVADSVHIMMATCSGSRNHRDITKNEIDIMKTYEKLIREYPVDPTRIFITGFSGQGVQSLRALLRFPQQFRGVFAVCAHRGQLVAADYSKLKDRYVFLLSRDNDFNLAENEHLHGVFRYYEVADTLVVTAGEHTQATTQETLNACIWLLEKTSKE
jgi:predicted esterase